MVNREIHQCKCRECQEGNEAIRKQHEHLNVLMSRLDEQQRRWMAALEANKIGHGGTKKLRAITGLDSNTIRRGREELEEGLINRPTQRIRVAGGGRKGIEKK